MKLELTNDEADILSCLIDNEIESDTDHIRDVRKKEKEYWKNLILSLKNLKEKFSPSEIVEGEIGKLEQKAWGRMTGEDVANNLSKEEAEEYYSLLGAR